MADRLFRWGILATGDIAAKFTEDLRLLPNAEVLAVGSRSLGAAKTFADRWRIPRAYGSWTELAADPDVDIVYVATPHAAHYAATLVCLAAGKAVLCEKPLTLDAAQARELAAVATARGVFLMEAMWMRCLPAIRHLTHVIADGAIGDISAVHATFGLTGPFAADHRLRDPALGGGALLDLGIYPVSLAHLLLGTPAEIRAWARLSPEGVDENTGVLLGYDSGALAALTCGIVGATGNAATIAGTTGWVDLPGPFYRPETISVYRRRGAPLVIESPFDGWGYHFEAIEVHHCLLEGLTESPLVPLAATVEVLDILDAVRAEIGVSYSV